MRKKWRYQRLGRKGGKSPFTAVCRSQERAIHPKPTFASSGMFGVQGSRCAKFTVLREDKKPQRQHLQSNSQISAWHRRAQGGLSAAVGCRSCCTASEATDTVTDHWGQGEKVGFGYPVKQHEISHPIWCD